MRKRGTATSGSISEIDKQLVVDVMYLRAHSLANHTQIREKTGLRPCQIKEILCGAGWEYLEDETLWHSSEKRYGEYWQELYKARNRKFGNKKGT